MSSADKSDNNLQDELLEFRWSYKEIAEFYKARAAELDQYHFEIQQMINECTELTLQYGITAADIHSTVAEVRIMQVDIQSMLSENCEVQKLQQDIDSVVPENAEARKLEQDIEAMISKHGGESDGLQSQALFENSDIEEYIVDTQEMQKKVLNNVNENNNVFKE